MNDYIQLATIMSKEELAHVANVVITGIHDNFHAHADGALNTVLHQKLVNVGH